MQKSISKRLFVLVSLFVLFFLPVQAQELQVEVSKLEEVIQRYHDADTFQGVVLVAVGDQVVYSKGWGYLDSSNTVPNGPDSKFRIGSITKQFTAALILRLAEEGLLDLSSSMSEYFPEFSQEPGSEVTVHQLLNHTAGIPTVALPDSLLDSSGLALPEARIRTPGVFELRFEPGSSFSYSNQGYHLLGDLVERVTGLSYDEAIQSYILGPAGLTDTGSHYRFLELTNEALGIESDQNAENLVNKNLGCPGAAGNLYSTAQDLLRWNRMLYGGSVFKSDQSLTLMTSPGLRSYGYGIRISADSVRNETRIRYHHGGLVYLFRSNLQYLPENEVTIVVLENWSKGRPGPVANDLRNVIHGIEPTGPERSN